jgi:integrase
MCLYGGQGERKYLSAAERGRAIRAFGFLDKDKALFALTLAWTGARVSEVLALRAHCFQLEECRIAVRTLKRRRLVVREVPVPQELMAELDRHFGLREMQRTPALAGQRLWLFCRTTAWRFIRGAMIGSGIAGLAGCPRGLRHSFAVGALQSHVPLHLVQRWLGHARIGTTAIYANVSGAEEREFAARFWRVAQSGQRLPGGGVTVFRQVWCWIGRWARRAAGGREQADDARVGSLGGNRWRSVRVRPS